MPNPHPGPSQPKPIYIPAFWNIVVSVFYYAIPVSLYLPGCFLHTHHVKLHSLRLHAFIFLYHSHSRASINNGGLNTLTLAKIVCRSLIVTFWAARLQLYDVVGRQAHRVKLTLAPFPRSCPFPGCRARQVVRDGALQLLLVLLRGPGDLAWPGETLKTRHHQRPGTFPIYVGYLSVHGCRHWSGTGLEGLVDLIAG